jgi:hypothetical protein
MYPNNDNEQQQPASVIDLSQLSDEQKEILLNQLKTEKATSREKKREAYESLRSEFLNNVRMNLQKAVTAVTTFHSWLNTEVRAFGGVLEEYGKLRNTDQQSFTIGNDEFKLEVKSNKVKGFDERADVAAARLIDFMNEWISNKEDGQSNPMYKLAMSLLERNQQGDLDYKSISKLYELEGEFLDPDYNDIMQLFKESNVVQKTALNYYFWERDGETNVWHRIEPSFCRL